MNNMASSSGTTYSAMTTESFDESHSPTNDSSTGGLTEELEKVKAERDQLWGKLEQIAEALGTDNPMRVVHDLRNVMNELVLLRKLVNFDDED